MTSFAYDAGDFGNDGIIYSGQPGTSSAVLVTAAASESMISEIIAVNETTAAATLTIWHGVKGAAATTSNEIVPAQSVPANSAVTVFNGGDPGYRLEKGDVIRGLQGTSGALNVRITGKA